MHEIKAYGNLLHFSLSLSLSLSFSLGASKLHTDYPINNFFKFSLMKDSIHTHEHTRIECYSLS